ncbi:hypothetical protein DLAC_09229 [Tieghemostelium lacteum]|uniref:Uncharacterized protein n=1 Tax=Tieghemostelium lacteum TaxID=361077 RepID=A0A151Z9H6_TIELA|nr:hypothetical protein DLAC_09229 [Tieghemostelium lacteum]|eukprot:KYQ90601.1 hypothetical protein DLAC_09229 [Tieghemostelium lacteum]
MDRHQGNPRQITFIPDELLKWVYRESCEFSIVQIMYAKDTEDFVKYLPKLIVPQNFKNNQTEIKEIVHKDGFSVTIIGKIIFLRSLLPEEINGMSLPHTLTSISPITSLSTSTSTPTSTSTSTSTIPPPLPSTLSLDVSTKNEKDSEVYLHSNVICEYLILVILDSVVESKDFKNHLSGLSTSLNKDNKKLIILHLSQNFNINFPHIKDSSYFRMEIDPSSPILINQQQNSTFAAINHLIGTTNHSEQLQNHLKSKITQYLNIPIPTPTSLLEIQSILYNTSNPLFIKPTKIITPVSLYNNNYINNNNINNNIDEKIFGNSEMIRLRNETKINIYSLHFSATNNPNKYTPGSVLTHNLVIKTSNTQAKLTDKRVSLKVTIDPKLCFCTEYSNITYYNNNQNIQINLMLINLKQSISNTFQLSFYLYIDDQLEHRLVTIPIVFIGKPSTPSLPSPKPTPPPAVNNSLVTGTNSQISNSSSSNLKHHPYKKTVPSQQQQQPLEEEDVNYVEKPMDGISVLMKAVMQKEFARAKSLIERGARINEKNKLGQTSLHTACYIGVPIQFIHYLVENHCDYLARDTLGFSGLNLAMEMGHLELVQDLIRCYPDFLLIQNNKGLYPLHYAVLANKIELVKIFANYQMEIYQNLIDYNMDDMDTTPMSDRDSIYYMPTDTINDDYLIRKLNSKYDFINLTDNDGMTPLHWAAALGFFDIFKLLLTFGGINLVDNGGESPIFKSHTSKLNITQYIKSHKHFNPDIINKKGQSAREI